jgi:hypothetical protein
VFKLQRALFDSMDFNTNKNFQGVDVTWLKKLVINRHFTPNSQNSKVITHPSGSTDAVDELVSPTDLSATPSESQNLYVFSALNESFFAFLDGVRRPIALPPIV